MHLNSLIIRLKSELHFLHVFKDTKPQARRALLACADDELIKAIVECAIHTLNGNHKLTKDEKSILIKYKNRFRSLVYPKTSFNRKRKLSVQMGWFIDRNLASVLSGVIETQINNN